MSGSTPCSRTVMGLSDMYDNRFLAVKAAVIRSGFDEYYQAGWPNKFHRMNIVATSKVLNLQYWIFITGGYGPEEHYIAYRSLDNIMAPSKRIKCKNQKEMCSVLDTIKVEIAAAKQAAQ